MTDEEKKSEIEKAQKEKEPEMRYTLSAIKAAAKDIIPHAKGEGDETKKHMNREEAISMGWEIAAQRAMAGLSKELENPSTSEDGGINIDKIIGMKIKYEMLKDLMGTGTESKRKTDPDDDPKYKQLKDELDRIKKENEETKKKLEREELLKEIDRRLEPLIKNQKDGEKSDPMMDELRDLRQQILKKDMDEKEKREESRFQRLTDSYTALQDQLMRLEKDKSKGTLTDLLKQSREIEETKKELAKALGLSAKEGEEASASDLLEQATDALPKLARGVRDLVDAARPRDIDDDLPPKPPEDMPMRDVGSHEMTDQLDPEIRAFLNKCDEVDGQLIDPEGIGWVSVGDGRKLSKKDVRSIALVDPETVLKRIRTVRPKPKPVMAPKPKTPPVEIPTAEEEEEIPDDVFPEDVPSEPAPSTEKPEPDKPEEKDARARATEYIKSLQLKEDPETKKPMLVGKYGEIYQHDDGTPISDANELLTEAEADPEGFLNLATQAQENAKALQDAEKNEKNDA